MKKHPLHIFFCILIGICLSGCGSIWNPSPESPSTPLSVTMPEDGTLRIAQFTDFHFGTEGEQYHNADEARTLAFMDHIVATTQPDLIVLTGDNIMCTGVEGIKELIGWMDKYETPWTLIWGNHDTMAYSWGISKKDISNYIASCGSKYLMYREDYIETGKEDRYGNFSISVMDAANEHLLGALLLMDSGTYDYDLESYQSITVGQMDWYKNKIASLQGIYEKQAPSESYAGNAHTIIPSIVFAHIPLPEHSLGYRKAKENNGAEFVIYQEVNSRFLNVTQSSSPSDNTNFFTVLKETGSTKAYFVGHMHGLQFQVKMDGILLGFGPQTGFAKMGSSATSKKTCYVYEINQAFELETIKCSEP